MEPVGAIRKTIRMLDRSLQTIREAEETGLDLGVEILFVEAVRAWMQRRLKELDWPQLRRSGETRRKAA